MRFIDALCVDIALDDLSVHGYAKRLDGFGTVDDERIAGHFFVQFRLRRLLSVHENLGAGFGVDIDLPFCEKRLVFRRYRRDQRRVGVKGQNIRVECADYIVVSRKCRGIEFLDLCVQSVFRIRIIFAH